MIYRFSPDMADALGLEELGYEEMAQVNAGAPWWVAAPVAGYLLKTIGDNWGSFKAGIRDGAKQLKAVLAGL